MRLRVRRWLPCGWLLRATARDGQSAEEQQRKTLLLPSALLLGVVCTWWTVDGLWNMIAGSPPGSHRGRSRVSESDGKSGTGRVLAVVANFLMASALLSLVAHALCRGTLPVRVCEWAMLQSSAGLLIWDVNAMLGNAWFSAAAAVWPITIIALDVLLVIDARRHVSILLCAVVVVWIAFRELYIVLTHPDWDGLDSTQAVVTYVSLLALSLPVLALDFYFTRTFAEEMRKENRRLSVTVEVTQGLTDALVNYDCDKAEQAINSSDAALPSELRRSLGELVVNLRRYRPHLPDYVLDSSSKSCAWNEIADQLFMPPVVSPKVSSQRSSNDTDNMEQLSNGWHEFEEPERLSGSSEMLPMVDRRGLEERNVALLLLRLERLNHSAVKAPRWAVRSVIDRVGNTVRACAQDTAGVVHALDCGGDVVISWGAATPVPAAAAAACVCALQVVHSEPLVPVRAAVSFGECLVGAVGAGDGGVALHLLGPLRDSALRLLSYAAAGTPAVCTSAAAARAAAWVKVGPLPGFVPGGNALVGFHSGAGLSGSTGLRMSTSIRAGSPSRKQQHRHLQHLYPHGHPHHQHSDQQGAAVGQARGRPRGRDSISSDPLLRAILVGADGGRDRRVSPVSGAAAAAAAPPPFAAATRSRRAPHADASIQTIGTSMKTGSMKTAASRSVDCSGPRRSIMEGTLAESAVFEPEEMDEEEAAQPSDAAHGAPAT